MPVKLLHILRALPSAMPVLEAAQRAAQGDTEAIAYLKSQGVYDALDAIVRPGAGDVTKAAVRTVREYFANSPIDAEYRVLEDAPPWSGFVRRLFNSTSGGNILLGPMGQGKTSLAIKLAYQWHSRPAGRIFASNGPCPEIGDGHEVARRNVFLRLPHVRLAEQLRALVLRIGNKRVQVPDLGLDLLEDPVAPVAHLFS